MLRFAAAVAERRFEAPMAEGRSRRCYVIDVRRRATEPKRATLLGVSIAGSVVRLAGVERAGSSPGQWRGLFESGDLALLVQVGR